MKQISFIILIGIIIGCDSENISQSDVINTIDDIENTVDDIENTVDDIEQKKQYNINVRQALVDIKDIQIKYKKAYGLYSDDYKELKRFLIEEKSKLITLRVPNGKNEDSIYKMIDMPITIEHQIILGYDHTDINDYKNISDGYNDDEALKCGLLIADTLFINMII